MLGCLWLSLVPCLSGSKKLVLQLYAFICGTKYVKRTESSMLKTGNGNHWHALFSRNATGFVANR